MMLEFENVGDFLFENVKIFKDLMGENCGFV